MKKRGGHNGFSIIEVIFLIVVLSIAIPSLLQLFAENTITGAKVAILPTANMLGVGLMEEIRSRKFDELSAKDGDGNWSTTMGSDGAEGAVKANFDDVDDFDGWVETFAAPYADYSASVTVDYVSSNNLTTPLVIPGPVPDGWTPSYKLIQVAIDDPGLAVPITLTTVVTEVQSL